MPRNSNSPIPQAASGFLLRAREAEPDYLFPMATDLDAPRALLVSLVEQRDLNLANLSRAIGKAHSYLQQYLRRGIPRTLPEDVRERLASVLGVSPEALRGAVPGKGAPREATADAIALTPDEVSALRAFRALSPAAKKRALLILPTLD